MEYAENQTGFYYIEVRPNKKYKTFRTRHAGEKDGIERVVGQCEDGTWETVKWLLSKTMAHIENGILIADHLNAEYLFASLVAPPRYIEGSRFKAKDRAKDRAADICQSALNFENTK